MYIIYDHCDIQESEHQEVRAEEHHTSSRPETNESEQEPEVSAAGVRDLQDAFGILVERK